MLYKIIGIVAALFLMVGIYNRELLSYGWMQAKGQFTILMNVKPVEDVLADPTFPDSLKQQILLIQEIKKFGVDSLGLNPSDNYTTFYDQNGQPILWVLTASEKYNLTLPGRPARNYYLRTRGMTPILVRFRPGLPWDI